ncbi:phosphoribosyltransferase [Gaoshiqia sediminis]|uniref:Phosphoribosyltransferase n=1 Tax=Gaoshiqia sediminis TaxID=2986998 RepID=A0AA42C6K7_9BACT|nr:phosphoribosyltransferase [Gaoshiqia sediminis]MCW0482629.1 phosphoribosyltransferase [Gaoshiqia sediminis]
MVPLSFQEISERLRQQDLPEVDLVIGIGTGGVVAASLVAFHLKCDLQIITLNYRDETNTPQREEPLIIRGLAPGQDLNGKKILLVDDVSVSGKTMQQAISALGLPNIQTFALKGKADYVLFPEVKECVKWPWK